MTNPLVAQAADSTRWYTGMGLVEDAHQITSGIRDNSWVDATLGGVTGSLDALVMVIDPLGQLASWGVGWLLEHVRPLREALDWLAGNADEVAAHAATWSNVSRFTHDTAAEFTARLRAEVSGWFGASGDAYREHAAMQTKVLEGLSEAASGIAFAVEGAGLLVALVREIVRDLIADFVGTLAVRLPQWLAEVGVTLGIATPVVVAQVSALVVKWVNRIQSFVRALLKSLARLGDKLTGLGDVITNLTRYADDLADSADVPSAGGLASTPRTPASGFPPDWPPDINAGDHVDGPPSLFTPSGWREGDPIPPALDSGGVPTDARLGEHYRNENNPDVDAFLRPNLHVVHYMDGAEREGLRLFVDRDGLLRQAADGEVFDTSTATSLHSDGKRAIFVMDGSGNLYATPNHEFGRIHHSSLVAGEDVAGAGEVRVEQGRLIEMTDQSGHYRPTPEMNDRVLDVLRSQGLRPADSFAQYGWNEVRR